MLSAVALAARCRAGCWKRTVAVRVPALILADVPDIGISISTLLRLGSTLCDNVFKGNLADYLAASGRATFPHC